MTPVRRVLPRDLASVPPSSTLALMSRAPWTRARIRSRASVLAEKLSLAGLRN
jgi:hypothetical protein